MAAKADTVRVPQRERSLEVGVPKPPKTFDCTVPGESRQPGSLLIGAVWLAPSITLSLAEALFWPEGMLASGVCMAVLGAVIIAHSAFPEQRLSQWPAWPGTARYALTRRMESALGLSLAAAGFVLQLLSIL